MREREDFCWVKPKAEFGSASHVAGNFSFACSQEHPIEVTLAEWEHVLKELGVFELCNPPKQSPKREEG